MNKLGGALSEGVIRVGQVTFTWPMQIQLWLCWGESSMQERWHPTTGCTGGGLNTEILVAVPSVLTLEPYNSVFPCIFLAPPPPAPKLLSLHQRPRCMPDNESVHRPFKETSSFPAALPLTQIDKIPADFHSYVLWGFFPALVPWAEEPNVGLGLLTPHREPL